MGRSIQKNRNGVEDVDLEFCEHFEYSMFETDGGRVQEELIDDRIFVE